MSYETELQRLVQAKATMRQSIIDKGVDVPEDAKIEDYPGYITQIVSGGGGYDPDNPTLEGLKAALDAGDYTAFPPNTPIPDKYGDTDINWVVGHYGTATMSDGTTKEGVYLFKDRALDTQMTLTNSHPYTNTSTIPTYLNDTYFPGCSETLKSLVGEISLPVATNKTSPNKLWLMSLGEMMVVEPTEANGGGVPWDAWKIRTGLTSPSIDNNVGRVISRQNGTVTTWWPRMSDSSMYWGIMNTAGGYAQQRLQYSLASWLLPACFIPKGGN